MKKMSTPFLRHCHLKDHPGQLFAIIRQNPDEQYRVVPLDEAEMWDYNESFLTDPENVTNVTKNPKAGLKERGK